MKIQKPTIDDYTVALHDHSDDANGGLISGGGGGGGYTPGYKISTNFRGSQSVATTGIATFNNGQGVSSDIASANAVDFALVGASNNGPLVPPTGLFDPLNQDWDMRFILGVGNSTASRAWIAFCGYTAAAISAILPNPDTTGGDAPGFNQAHLGILINRGFGTSPMPHVEYLTVYDGSTQTRVKLFESLAIPNQLNMYEIQFRNVGADKIIRARRNTAAWVELLNPPLFSTWSVQRHIGIGAKSNGTAGIRPFNAEMMEWELFPNGASH